jgi:hypothetical protein
MLCAVAAQAMQYTFWPIEEGELPGSELLMRTLYAAHMTPTHGSAKRNVDLCVV